MSESEKIFSVARIHVDNVKAFLKAGLIICIPSAGEYQLSINDQNFLEIKKVEKK